MRTFNDDRNLILKFMKDNNMCPMDILRITKTFCVCETCKYFAKHYNEHGDELDFGHCFRGNTNKAKMKHNASCGYWDL